MRFYTKHVKNRVSHLFHRSHVHSPLLVLLSTNSENCESFLLIIRQLIYNLIYVARKKEGELTEAELVL